MKYLRILALLAALVHACNAAASYAIYVGKNLTEDGSVLIGGSGDEVSSHWLEVVPAKDHDDDAMITVGVTPKTMLLATRTQNASIVYLKMGVKT